MFDDDIDHALFAKEFLLDAPAQKLSIDASLAKVQAANPGWEIRIPELPSAPNQALLYELRQRQRRQWVFAHPATGEMLATNTKAHFRLTQVLLDLHYNLLSGTPGMVVVFFVGIALLVLTVSGFILYRKSILKVLTFRQRVSFKSRRALFSSLHRVVGVWALAFNLLLCATGLTLSFVVVQHAVTAPETAATTPPLLTSVDAALARIQKAYPNFEVTYISIPKNDQAQLYFLGKLKTDPAYYGAFYSSIPVNYTSWELGQPYFLREQPLLKRVFVVLQATHFGDYAGYFVKLLYCLGGLMPGILSISGFVIWHFRSKPAASPTVSKKPLRKKVS